MPLGRYDLIQAVEAATGATAVEYFVTQRMRLVMPQEIMMMRKIHMRKRANGYKIITTFSKCTVKCCINCTVQ